jgi:hypothetical protein
VVFINGDRSAQLHKTVIFGKRKIEGYAENISQSVAVFPEFSMSFRPAEMLVLRRFGDEQLVTLAKEAIETAFQPVVEA